MAPSLSALPVFVALFLGFFSVTLAMKCDEKKHCQTICPKYEVLSRTEEFEEREYDRIVWICTDVKDETFDAVNKARSNLVDFSKKTDIDRYTWPVKIKIELVDNERKYEMCWFVKPEDESKVQDASEYPVRVEEEGPTKMFVRCFGGTPSLTLEEDNAELLEDALEAANKHHGDKYSAGIYESYFALTHNNEVMVDEQP